MSALSSALVDYLDLRRGLGYKLSAAGPLLSRFVNHLDNLGVEVITVASALSWATETGRNTGVSRRLEVIRGFARYMQAIDTIHEVPPVGLAPLRRNRATPHIYSDEDLTALLSAARSLEQPLRAATTETVIGLLAATGMRIGEVLALDDTDIDWSTGVVNVVLGKFNKSRHVPLHQSTLQALETYQDTRHCLSGQNKVHGLFVGFDGARLGYPVFKRSFIQAVDLAGLRALSGGRPRVHDLRHSFAVKTLLDWYYQDLDVQALLPRLSTYLGHVSPSATYWYLTGTPELLGLVAQRLDRREGAK